MRLIEAEIRINRRAAEIFDYVTRPAKWYEWFTSSIESDTEDRPKVGGDSFSVGSIQKWHKNLPFKIERSVDWEVVECYPSSTWRIISNAPSVEIDVLYELIEENGVTLLKRSFRYKPKGVFRILEPLIFRKKWMKDATASLRNLREVLEGHT